MSNNMVHTTQYSHNETSYDVCWHSESDHARAAEKAHNVTQHRSALVHSPTSIAMY